VRPRSSPWAYRSLIWNFARRDLKARFRGTALGWAWSLLIPLATLLTFSLVFAVVFRFEPPPFGDGSEGNFTVWLLAGLVVWNFFLGVVTVSMPTLLATGPLFQKVYLPPYAPIFGTTIAIMLQSLVELGLLLFVLGFFGNVGVTWALVPAWFGLLLLFVAASATVFSVLNVYYRDLAQLVAVGLQLLFYLTPIIYSADLVPTEWHGLPLRSIIEHLPLSEFVIAFRTMTYGLDVPSGSAWLAMLGWAGVAAVLAVAVYRWRGRDLGEFT
jgi:ABC-type polysaccharide/polyol phosphate export permease